MGGFRVPVFSFPALRRACAGVALVAMSALLLAPVCDALEPLPEANAHEQVRPAAGDHPDSEACCDALSVDGSVIASVTLPWFMQGDAGPAVEAPKPQPRLQASTHAAVPGPPRPPQRSLRYHARTARILA